MVAKTRCQHCRSEFEADGTKKSEFCPHCGKETIIFRQVAFQKPAYAAPTSEAKKLLYLILAGYLGAILTPLVGFIIGIILITKNRVGIGIGCIIVGLIVVLLKITLH